MDWAATARERCAGVITRILRWHDLDCAIVRIQTRAGVIVAVPCELPDRRVLDLACLVLSDPEFAELCDQLKPDAPDDWGNFGTSRP